MKHNSNKGVNDNYINGNKRKTLTLLSGKLGSDLRVVASSPSNPQCVTVPDGNFSLSENGEELKMQRELECVQSSFYYENGAISITPLCKSRMSEFSSCLICIIFRK